MNPSYLVAGVVLLIGTACAVPTAPPHLRGGGSSPLTVGENVLVSSANPDWEHTEYMADADPADPGRIMVCSMLFSPAENRLTSGLYFSSDGGDTWEFSLNDDSSRFLGVWDPACAYGIDGEALFLTLGSSDSIRQGEEWNSYEGWLEPGPNNMPLYRSSDGGASWGPPLVLGAIDNEDITIDRTDGPYRGRIYIYGNANHKKEPGQLRYSAKHLWLAYSADGGSTFHRSERTEVERYDAWHAGSGTILPDGTLLLPYYLVKDPEAKVTEKGYYTLSVAASEDGGEHIGIPVEVKPLAYCLTSRTTTEGQISRSCGAVTPFMASDHTEGAFRGRAYLVWGERFRDHCAVFLASSNDRGATWSKPIKVSDERPRTDIDQGPDIFLPAVAVNTEGVVGVTWYDRREDPDNRAHRLRFSASMDGGETWLPSVPVSTHQFTFSDPPPYPVHAVALGGGRRRNEEPSDSFEVWVWPGPRLYDGWHSGMGDYAGIAAGADGRFHAFWIDNRTGVAQMYTAAITVEGVPIPNGSTALAGLDNVTPLLELQYTSSVWDPVDHTVTLEFQLLNTSENEIAGPLMLRITELDSDLGVPSLLLPDDATGAAGTVLDVTQTLPADRLGPGQTTAPQLLRVKLDAPHNSLSHNGARDVVRFDVKAFANRSTERTDDHVSQSR